MTSLRMPIMLEPNTYTIEHLLPIIAAPSPPRRRLGLTSSADLMTKELPPIRYVVPGIIAEGLTLLAGKSKIGKSWLILGTAIAVATGGYALGSIKVDEGDVLYLALEDNERRLQSRLKKLLPDARAPHRLFIDIACRRLDQGLLDDLREWIASAAQPRLIIIDVLNRIRPGQKHNEGVYDYDVRSLEGLQGLAAEFGVAIILVHHTRKADAEDPFDCLSGSTGLPGTADTTFVLARDSQGVTLYGRGRDIEEVERALNFDKVTGQWLILGEAADVRRSGERGAILEVLKEASEPLSPLDVAETTGFKRENVKKLLREMAKAGEAQSLGPRKGYVHPMRSDLLAPGSHGYRVTKDGEI
jgi:RecA-family ATPase